MHIIDFEANFIKVNFYRIVEAMDFYRDGTGQKQLPQFTDEFPYSITVDQAVATWKHIIYFQENIEQQT